MMSLNPFPNKPWFLRVCTTGILKTLWEKEKLHYRYFENTVGKKEIARNEQFLLFPQCFLPIWRTFCHFHRIQNCRLQTLLVWKSLKFVVCESVKSFKSLLCKKIFKKSQNL